MLSLLLFQRWQQFFDQNLLIQRFLQFKVIPLLWVKCDRRLRPFLWIIQNLLKIQRGRPVGGGIFPDFQRSVRPTSSYPRYVLPALPYILSRFWAMKRIKFTTYSGLPVNRFVVADSGGNPTGHEVADHIITHPIGHPRGAVAKPNSSAPRIAAIHPGRSSRRPSRSAPAPEDHFEAVSGASPPVPVPREGPALWMEPGAARTAVIASIRIRRLLWLLPAATVPTPASTLVLPDPCVFIGVLTVVD